jgi:hypothetical protein
MRHSGGRQRPDGIKVFVVTYNPMPSMAHLLVHASTGAAAVLTSFQESVKGHSHKEKGLVGAKR